MHLDYIENMYIKNKLNKLTDSDIKEYYNKFIVHSYYAGGRRDRLNKAVFMFNNTGSAAQKQLLDHINDVLAKHDLLIFNVVMISIPLFYITFDGTFAVKLQKLIDDHITPLEYKEKDIPYFVLFDRSDLFIQASVYTVKSRCFYNPSPPECLKNMEKKIEGGYFRDTHFEESDLKGRVLFWKSLDYDNVSVCSKRLGNGLGLDLPGTQAYPAYLEKKKGVYPDINEQCELRINHYNKLVPLIVTVTYEFKERLYKYETLDDLYNFYIGLGIIHFRYIGVGVFKIEDIENYNDMILNKENWEYLEKEQYKDQAYFQYLSLKRWMLFFLDYRKRNIRRILESSLDFDNIGKLKAVSELNILTDPTMDVRPKYRHPVTYDYFTTPRITHCYDSNIASVKEEDLALCVPVLELTEEIKSLIEEHAPKWGYSLTNDANEDEYFIFRDFDIEGSKEQLEKDLKDPIYLASKERNLKKVLKLMDERREEEQKSGLRHARCDDKPVGIRKHLNLKPEDNFQ